MPLPVSLGAEIPSTNSLAPSSAGSWKARKNQFQECTTWFVSPLSSLKRCSIWEGPLSSSLFPPLSSPPPSVMFSFSFSSPPPHSALPTFFCHYNLLPFLLFLVFLSRTPHFLCILFSSFSPNWSVSPSLPHLPWGPMMFQVELVGMGAQFQGHREGVVVQKGDHQKNK